MAQRVLFCKIGWMTRYEGKNKADPIRGRHRYIKKRKSGSEMWTFENVRDRYYGFVWNYGNDINIDNLGADEDDESISNVLVIWLAAHPDATGVHIVGWYRNATVYRVPQRIPHIRRPYQITASAEDVTRLPYERREEWTLPPGTIRSPFVWYALDCQEVVRSALGFVDRFDSGDVGPSMTRPPRRVDPADRAAVEIAAMDAVCAHYSKTHKVTRVHRDNRGWDVEARNARENLLLEIKGLSGDGWVVELTPNEYDKLIEHRELYRVCIVRRALTKPVVQIFRLVDKSTKRLRSSDGEIFRIVEKIGAVLRR